MTTFNLTNNEKLNGSPHLIACMYEVGDDYEVRILQDLLERVGFQADCECGRVIYHDSPECNSCSKPA